MSEYENPSQVTKAVVFLSLVVLWQINVVSPQTTGPGTIFSIYYKFTQHDLILYNILLAERASYRNLVSPRAQLKIIYS